MLRSPHHVIPDPQTIGGSSVEITGGFQGNAGNISVSTPITQQLNASLPPYPTHSMIETSFLIALIIFVLALAVLSLAYMGKFKHTPLAEKLVPQHSPIYYSGMYVYRGYRRKAREVFLQIRKEAEKRLGISLLSKTLYEITHLLGLREQNLPTIYSLIMYSSRSPTMRDLHALECEAKRVIQQCESQEQ
jgi:hypothetical protein